MPSIGSVRDPSVYTGGAATAGLERELAGLRQQLAELPPVPERTFEELLSDPEVANGHTRARFPRRVLELRIAALEQRIAGARANEAFLRPPSPPPSPRPPPGTRPELPPATSPKPWSRR